MLKRLSIKRTILIALTAAMLLFIWGQSLLPQDVSAQESGWFTVHILNPILGWFGMTADRVIVRKLAHVTEYAVYAFLVTLYFDGKAKRVFPIGFLTAFSDETVQIFSKRGPMIADVWIDLLGVAIGFAAAGGVTAFIRLRKQRRSTQQTA